MCGSLSFVLSMHVHFVWANQSFQAKVWFNFVPGFEYSYCFNLPLLFVFLYVWGVAYFWVLVEWGCLCLWFETKLVSRRSLDGKIPLCL